MTLGDLMEELRENILHDRSDATEGSDDDRLWSDKTLRRYINQAQRRFARKSLILHDNSDQYGLVKCVEGQSLYQLDPLVLSVLSVKQGTDIADLARAGHSSFNSFFVPDTYYFDPSSLSSLPPGKPVAFSTDETLTKDDDERLQVVNLRIYPAPKAPSIADFHARVVRLPAHLEEMDDPCEIPEDHQLEMLDWAAYLALRMADRDAEDQTRAKERQAAFEANVKDARNAVMRKLFAPQQWGFGRNGFSWER